MWGSEYQYEEKDLKMALPDISLRAFNKIATGKYNAGLIDFATDEDGKITLTKVNNHIKKVKLNKVKLTPERILEVKETFINALQKGGVTNEDLAESARNSASPRRLTLIHRSMHRRRF